LVVSVQWIVVVFPLEGTSGKCVSARYLLIFTQCDDDGREKRSGRVLCVCMCVTVLPFASCPKTLFYHLSLSNAVSMLSITDTTAVGGAQSGASQ